MTQKRVGDRIAEHRKLASLTQVELAQRMGYSVHMVRAIERGRDTPSEAFINAAAAALSIDRATLTGTPFYDAIEDEGPIDGLSALRTILAEGAYVRADEPSGPEDLAATLAEVESAIRGDRTRRAMALLPPLIRQLHGAIRAASGEDHSRLAYRMLCDAYLATEAVCCRLGYQSLTALVLDRLDWAAPQTHDSGYIVRSLMKRARLLMANGSTDVAMILVEQGLSMLTGESESDRVLRGYGLLRGSIVAARSFDLSLAQDYVERARRIAADMTHESDLYGTMFGPGNVEIHACAIELEAGDPGKAARTGSALILPPDMAAPRAGHHWQDVARAWLMAGRPDEALKALNKAREIAPQQTRLAPAVHETWHGIQAAQRRKVDPTAAFGRWLKISA